MSEGLGAEAAEDVVGVAETAVSAAGAVAHAAEGDWERAADGALDTSEHALGVASLGVTDVYDAVAHETGLPSVHDALSEVTHVAGDALGDGLFDPVGADQSHQAAVDFDDGNILSGIGHMAEGAGETIENAVAQGAHDVGAAVSDAADSVEQGVEEFWNQATE